MKLRGEPVRIPLDKTGTNWKDICIDKIISYYESESEQGKMYHLHPELVQVKNSDEQGCIETTMLCSSCYKSLENFEAPKLSIAKGVDFGVYSRLKELELPNMHERVIMSVYRLFGEAVKVQENKGMHMNYTRNIVQGHWVFFEHDGPRLAAHQLLTELYSKKRLKDAVKFILVGPDGSFEKIRKAIRASSTLIGRGFVVYQFLAVLQKLGNPIYKHLELPDFETFAKDFQDARRLSRRVILPCLLMRKSQAQMLHV